MHFLIQYKLKRLRLFDQYTISRLSRNWNNFTLQCLWSLSSWLSAFFIVSIITVVTWSFFCICKSPFYTNKELLLKQRHNTELLVYIPFLCMRYGLYSSQIITSGDKNNRNPQCKQIFLHIKDWALNDSKQKRIYIHGILRHLIRVPTILCKVTTAKAKQHCIALQTLCITVNREFSWSTALCYGIPPSRRHFNRINIYG